MSDKVSPSELKIEVGVIKTLQGEYIDPCLAAPGQISNKLMENLTDTLIEKIAAAIKRVGDKLQVAVASAKRAEVEFGVNIEAGGDVWIVSAKAGATITIRVIWEKT